VFEKRRATKMIRQILSFWPRFIIASVLVIVVVETMTSQYPVQFPEWAEYVEAYWKELWTWVINLLPDTGEEHWTLGILKYALAKLRLSVHGDYLIGVFITMLIFSLVLVLWWIITWPFRRIWRFVKDKEWKDPS